MEALDNINFFLHPTQLYVLQASARESVTCSRTNTNSTSWLCTQQTGEHFALQRDLMSSKWKKKKKKVIFSIVKTCLLCRAERERARVQQQSTGNKLFTLEGTDESGRPIYSPAPQVQQVCQVVDGFIYVANAEPGRGEITGAFVFLILSAPPPPPLLVAASRDRFVINTEHLRHSSQMRGSLSWATYRPCWAPVGAQPPGLSWSSLASPGRTRQNTGKGVEHPVSTWQRDSVWHSLPTPGW